MIDRQKYFDYNATTPLLDEARDIWLTMADQHWENPSSLYREAGVARRILEDLREDLAAELGIEDSERVVFTSGATESNNSVLHHWNRSGGVVAFSAVEHPCVRAAASGFFGPGRMLEISVDPISGVIAMDHLEEILAISESLSGVAVMAANNETGTIQPWDDIAELCREKEVPYLCDAAQWFGKEPIKGFGDIGYVTGCAHKFGGPKGTGFVILPEAFEECDFLGQLGGPQENGRRGGTENLPGIAAMVAALKAWPVIGSSDARDNFEKAIEHLEGFKIVGKRGPRLGNTSMMVLPHSRNLKWLTRLSEKGFGVSTGSACSAGAGNPSQVMLAMDLDYEEMGRVLRISGGPFQTDDDWALLFEALLEVKEELEAEA